MGAALSRPFSGRAGSQIGRLKDDRLPFMLAVTTGGGWGQVPSESPALLTVDAAQSDVLIEVADDRPDLD